MRDFGNARSAYNYTAPRIKQSKEASDNEKMWYSQQIADGNIIDFEPRTADQIYEDNLEPQDMSKIFKTKEQQQLFAQTLSNFQRKLNEVPKDGGKISYDTMIQIAEDGKLEVLGSFIKENIMFFKHGYDPSNPNNGAVTEAMLDMLNQDFLRASGIGAVGEEYG
jgi:hypothetical protein